MSDVKFSIFHFLNCNAAGNPLSHFVPQPGWLWGAVTSPSDSAEDVTLCDVHPQHVSSTNPRLSQFRIIKRIFHCA